MRPIAKPVLREFWMRHPQAEMPLRRWWKRTEAATWNNLAEVRADFPATDLVRGRHGDMLVFNVGGNDFRLICMIEFGRPNLLIRFVGTHAEYDRLNVREL